MNTNNILIEKVDVNKIGVILLLCSCLLSCNHTEDKKKSVIRPECIVCNSLEQSETAKDSVRDLILTNDKLYSYNILKSYPRLRSLTLIDYSDLNFDSLFYALSSIDSLNELTLDGCELKTIPRSIGYLRKLTSLHIRNDSINNVNSQFYLLISLSELEISTLTCDLNSDSLTKMVNLNSIFIGFGDSVIPGYIYNFRNIKELSLPANVKSLDIARLSQLRTLNLIDITGSKVAEIEWNYYRRYGQFNQLKNLKDKLPNCRIYIAPTYF